MKTLINPAREKLAGGGLSLGVGLRQARTVDVAKIMKSAGFDWLFIDLEHGSMDLDMAAQISVAALDVGIAPLVRIPKGEHGMATRALDNGAFGIVAPHVDDVDEARLIVERLKYPPLGHRSIGGAIPHYDFAVDDLEKAEHELNEQSLVVVMLESPDAIEAVDDIAAVEGIDVVMIGTNDLTTEMGIPGQFADDKVVAAYDRVIAACAKHGKWPGMGGVYAADLVKRYVGMGMKFILSGNDISLMMAAARERTGMLREIEKG